MTLTVETKQFLDGFNALPKKSMSETPIEVMRAATRLTAETYGSPFREVAATKDFTVTSTHNGPDILCRLYMPKETRRKGLYVYVHGGGWSKGCIETYDTNMRHFSEVLGIAIVSVQYRLSPEHKFPNHLEDAYDAYLWCHNNLKTLGVDDGPVYLSGDSAGGNITLGIMCMLNDNNEPLPHQYIGIYPPTDLRMDYASYDTYGEGYILSKEAVAHYVKDYCDTPGDVNNPYMSPILYTKLEDLPPMLVITAGCDPLFDEQAAFVQKIKDIGGDIKQRIFEGTVHPFVLLGGLFPEAEQAMKWVDANLRP